MTNKIKHFLSVLLIFLLVGASCATYQNIMRQNAAALSTQSVKSTQISIDHFVIIMEENKPQSAIIGNPQASYINSLIPKGAITTNFHSHLRNPYIALTSGETTSIANNCNPVNDKCEANYKNVTSEIEKSGRTWKMYAEGMSAPCQYNNTKLYTFRHNPFMFYAVITNNAAYCAQHVVPYSDLAKDLAANTLPNFVFISPNLCNDMHDCNISTGDKWLSDEVPKLLSSTDFTLQKSLLVITWDEGNLISDRILTMFLGSAAKVNYVSNKPYCFYSLLRTIERVWSLGTLSQNDKHDTPMLDMLK